MEAAMAESMVSIVVALVLVGTGIVIFTHHRREQHGQRRWDRMRHRH
jgi:hypothetical protein